MAARYAALPTTDDDARASRESSSASPGSAQSRSAVASPFLSLAETACTPSSMDSDLLASVFDNTSLGASDSTEPKSRPVLRPMADGLAGADSTMGPVPPRATVVNKHAPRPDVEWGCGQTGQDPPTLAATATEAEAEACTPEKHFRGRIRSDETEAETETQSQDDTAAPDDARARGRSFSRQGRGRGGGSIFWRATHTPPLAPAPSRGRPTAPAQANLNLDTNSTTHPAAQICNFNRNFSTSTTSSSSSSLISQLHEHLQQQSVTDNPRGPRPIIRTTSECDSLRVRHPAPDLNPRSGAYLGNIAQLEATAERLSMTSSIDDAIRDLHGALKRSDSQQSSRLAESVAALSEPDQSASVAIPPSLPRHLSAASIVETNTAARHGGYSPSGYVMSPNHSLTSRLRSASKSSSNDRPEMDFESMLSRSGPGKGSVRSVQSSKLSLAEISESEPVSLTQEVLDEADRTVLTEEDDDTIRPTLAQVESDVPNTDASHAMMGGGDYFQQPAPALQLADPEDIVTPTQERERPRSAHSTNTYDQAENAFAEFDGAHCMPEDVEFPPPVEHEFPEDRVLERPRPSRPASRPKSYFDHGTGKEMLYYPARVPMMLNLPPKLSNKPKAAVRNSRHSRVLGAMRMDQESGNQRESRVPDIPSGEGHRASWLPDPLEGHVHSPFSPLSSEDSPLRLEPSPLSDSQAEKDGCLQPSPEPTEPLVPSDLELPQTSPQARQRSPGRISPEARKSRASNLDSLPSQLRASAFFGLPSVSPDVEIKDGSAMATLDSILDASALAPVSAFTDHQFAGKLGAEVYGREKKRKSAMPAQRPTSAGNPRIRSMFLGVGRGKHEDPDRSKSFTAASTPDENGEEEGLLPMEEEVEGRREEEEEKEEDGDDGDDTYQGPPTTLLAELQLRKQQQKMRTRPTHLINPNGMHTTLLELDSVAEAQRVNRKSKRVNLAWEDPTERPNDESDDEDVPLGILYAAKVAGNNDISAVAAEVNRPLGLMEKRDIEDNEPLSHRRARLQGQEPDQLNIFKRRSMLTLNNSAMMSAHRLSRTPDGPLPGDEIDTEEEGETLGDRMRRLKAKEEAENALPRARPVSQAFSAELLSQFGDFEEGEKEKGKDKDKENLNPERGEEEETLGQRRRRLQAEKEAREREMGMGGDATRIVRRLSLSNVLSAYPVQEPRREELERRKAEEDARYLRDQDEKMKAFRMTMPAAVTSPTVNRTSAFKSGMYNDGMGGGSGVAGLPNSGLAAGHGAPMGPPWWNRSSMAPSGFGPAAAPTMMQQASYNTGRGFANGAYNSGLGTYGPSSGGTSMMNGLGMPTQATQMPIQMQLGMQMQMPMPQGQIDSIERWRQGLLQ